MKKLFATILILTMLASCGPSPKQVKLDESNPKVMNCKKSTTNVYDIWIPEWRDSFMTRASMEGYWKNCVRNYDQEIVDCKIAAKNLEDVSKCNKKEKEKKK